MWEKYDADSSGYIDRSEFLEFVKDTMGEEIRETMQEKLAKGEIEKKVGQSKEEMLQELYH